MDRSIPGFWQSGLTAHQATSASRSYGQIQVDHLERVYWVEYRPDMSGRNILCREHSDHSSVEMLTPDVFSVQSKVHEYGGTSWCLLDDELVFVNGADQQLYLQSLSQPGRIRQLTFRPDSRFLEPTWDRRRNRLIAIEEVHRDSDIENRLVSINLSDSSVESIAQGADFYTYPVLNSTGSQLAYICWSHPHQPWTKTSCHLVDLNDAGGPVETTEIVSGTESVSQPLFDTYDQLYVISDRGGWWNLYAWDVDSQALMPVSIPEVDMISAPWDAGLRHYGFIAELTGPQLCSVQITHEGCKLLLGSQSLAAEFNYFSAVCVSGKRIVCVAGCATEQLSIVEIDSGSSEVRHICGGERPLLKEDCALPKPMTFGVGERMCYGYLYFTKNHRYRESTEPASLLIFLHGGPTAASYPLLDIKKQYWTQRGFAVLDLNYRGSSNYGKAYRNALHRGWGLVEVEDIDTAVQDLIKKGCIDPNEIFIRGNSSGGLSALNAMIALDYFAAGSSLYGVTNPYYLNQVTHKFESYYLEWLIGEPESEKKRYLQRSPLINAEKVNCPVIFFQGEMDKVVLPEETRAMVKQLKRAHKEVEAYYFPDEAHGFRCSETAAFVLDKECSFYKKVNDLMKSEVSRYNFKKIGRN